MIKFELTNRYFIKETFVVEVIIQTHISLNIEVSVLNVCECPHFLGAWQE